MLINLVTNAIRYNIPDGRVGVSVDRGQEAITIRVSDTGPGIPEGMLDRLFIPFERLGSENSLEQGAGLGFPLTAGSPRL